MVCVDFGSGHNPRKGFKSCDITGWTDYYYDEVNNIIGGLTEKVDLFYLRNVIHHLPDIDRIIECISSYLKPNGKIIIIEPKKELYKSNLFLDTLWYRGIIPKPEIKIFGWRDYHSNFESNFNFKKKVFSDTKEITIYKMKGGGKHG